MRVKIPGACRASDVSLEFTGEDAALAQLDVRWECTDPPVEVSVELPRREYSSDDITASFDIGTEVLSVVLPCSPTETSSAERPACDV